MDRTSTKQLSFDEGLEIICTDAEIEYKSTELSFSDYIYQTATNSTDTLDFFTNLLTGNPDLDFGLVFRKIGTYIFVFMLCGIVFISWVCFGCCCICGCGLFKKRSSAKSGLFKIIIFGLFGLLIVLGIVAVGLSPSFSRYFSGSVCSFFQFFNHTLNGDSKKPEELPRWIGLDNINTELNETIDEINEMFDDLNNNVTQFEANFANHSKKFETLLDTELEKNVSAIVKGQDVLADYSTAFPLFLNEVRDRYSPIKDSFNEGIDLIKTQLDFSSFNDTFKQTSEQISKQITSVSTKIAGVRDKISDYTMVVYKTVSENIINSFKAVFGLFISFAVIGVVIFVLHSICNKCTCKCIVHLLWFGLLLFIMGGLTVGSILGIVGTIASEVIIILPHVVNNKFLSKDVIINIFGDLQEVVPYYDACLEEDGNLISKLGYSLEIEGIETIISESRTKINEFKNEIQGYSNIKELQDFIESIQSYHDDYSSAFSETSSTIGYEIFPEILSELNSNFSVDYNDIFVTNKDECPDGKTYLSPNETRVTGGSYCLVVHEWKPEQIEEIYSNLNELITAFRNLYNFIQDHNEVTGEMYDISSNMNLTLNSMVKTSLTFIQNVNESITSFEAFYTTNMGNQGALVNQVNCAFIKNDLITFIDQLFNGFASQAAQVGSVSIICSIVAYFAVIMLILYVNSSSDKNYNDINGLEMGLVN